MIQVRGGKLGVQGAVITLPEGFYLDTDPDASNEDTVNFYDPTQEYKIEIGFEAIDGGTDDFLQEVIEDMTSEDITSKVITPPTEFETNGLAGHWAVYRSGKHQYYEACLMFAGNDELNSIDVIVTAEISAALPQKMQDLPAIRAILNSIEPE